MKSAFATSKNGQVYIKKTLGFKYKLIDISKILFGYIRNWLEKYPLSYRSRTLISWSTILTSIIVFTCIIMSNQLTNLKINEGYTNVTAILLVIGFFSNPVLDMDSKSRFCMKIFVYLFGFLAISTWSLNYITYILTNKIVSFWNHFLGAVSICLIFILLLKILFLIKDLLKKTMLKLASSLGKTRKQMKLFISFISMLSLIAGIVNIVFNILDKIKFGK